MSKCKSEKEEKEEISEILCEMKEVSNTNTEEVNQNTEQMEIRDPEEELSEKSPFRIVEFCPYKIVVTLIYWLIFFSAGVGMGGIAITLTDYHEYLSEVYHVEIYVVSLIFLFRSLGFVFSGYILGKLCDAGKNPTRLYHLNLHHILGGIGVCGLSLPLCLSALIPFAPVSLLMHFFLGIGENAMLITTAILPKSLFESNKVIASVVQGSQFSLATGAFLFPLIIGSSIFRYDLDPWVNVYVVYFIAYIIAIIPFCLFFCPAPVQDREKVERTKRERFSVKEENDNNYTSELNDQGHKRTFCHYYCCCCTAICKKICKNSFLQKDIQKVREIWGCTTTLDENEEEEEEEEEEKNNKIEDSSQVINNETKFCQKVKLFWRYKRKQFHFLRFVFTILCGLSIIFYNAQNKTFQNLIFLYSKNRGWSKTHSAYTTTLYFSCYTLSRFFAVFVFLLANPVTMIFLLETAVVVNAIIMLIFQQYDTVIWICVGLAAFFNSPVFGALIILPICFQLQPSAVETSVILTSSGIGSLTPSLVSLIMAKGNFFFLVCVNVISVLAIVLFYITFSVGTILKHRNLKKKKKDLEERDN